MPDPYLSAPLPSVYSIGNPAVPMAAPRLGQAGQAGLSASPSVTLAAATRVGDCLIAGITTESGSGNPNVSGGGAQWRKVLELGGGSPNLALAVFVGVVVTSSTAAITGSYNATNGLVVAQFRNAVGVFVDGAIATAAVGSVHTIPLPSSLWRARRGVQCAFVGLRTGGGGGGYRPMTPSAQWTRFGQVGNDLVGYWRPLAAAGDTSFATIGAGTTSIDAMVGVL